MLARNLREGPNWLRGVIIRKLGPVTYEVKVKGQVWKRHVEQLLEYKGQAVPDESPLPVDIPDLPPVVPPAPAVLPSSTPNQPIQGMPDPGVHLPGEDPAPAGMDGPVQSEPHPATPNPVSPKAYPRRNRQQPDYI